MIYDNPHTPLLETERLILRPLRVSDAERIFSCWANDAEVTRYMSWSTHTSIEDTRAWLRFEEEAVFSSGNYTFGYVLKETNELIGSGGLLYEKDLARYGLGYILMKPYWGRGLATEAARRILDFAIEDVGLRRFFAYHAIANPASGNVIRKLGFAFQKEGTFISEDGNKTYPRLEYFLDV